jgi:hypothetical protein
MVNQTCDWLQCYSWKVTDHPPNFNLFGSLKKQPVSKKLETDADVCQLAT